MKVLTLHEVFSDTNSGQSGRRDLLLLSGAEVQPPHVVPTDTSEEGRELGERGSLLNRDKSLGSPLSCLMLSQQGSCFVLAWQDWSLCSPHDLVGRVESGFKRYFSCLARGEKLLSASFLYC